jgi:isopentenyl phosphate kinase
MVVSTIDFECMGKNISFRIHKPMKETLSSQGSKPLVLVKIGGSLITDKNTPYSVHLNIIERIAKEISEIRVSGKIDLILGHGGGSFPHVSAKKYQTAQGFIDTNSGYGMCVVQNDASRLNRIVVSSLLDTGVKAMSVQTSAVCMAKDSKIQEFYLDSIKWLLRHDIVPVPYGDIGLDRNSGCCILSTEEVFRFLASALHPKKIVMVGKVDGVFTADPIKDKTAKLIKQINRGNWEEMKKYLAGSDGTDVTGGMIHKIEQSIEMAKLGVEVEIINGLKEGNLKRCLFGEHVGTSISW